MHHTNEAMQACIDACTDCSQTCLSMATTHCLELGGEHASRKHITLMLECAEICRTSANIMLMGSPHHALICRACAEICEACAVECERLGDMEDCVAACRACAESCRSMAA